MGDPAELYTLTPETLVQRLADAAIAVRDQAEHADAETLAQICRAAVRRRPNHQFWGGKERCPGEPMVDLMRQTMNGDGFHATTAGVIRAAATATTRKYTPLDQLGMHRLVPLPRVLPDSEGALVLLYDGSRALILSAIGARDAVALAARTEWLLRELQRGEIEARPR